MYVSMYCNIHLICFEVVKNTLFVNKAPYLKCFTLMLLYKFDFMVYSSFEDATVEGRVG
jgi:hypothetical protein